MKLIIPLMLIWISSCSSLSKKCKYSGTIDQEGNLPSLCRYNETLINRVPPGMDAKDAGIKFNTYPVGNYTQSSKPYSALRAK